MKSSLISQHYYHAESVLSLGNDHNEEFSADQDSARNGEGDSRKIRAVARSA